MPRPCTNLVQSVSCANAYEREIFTVSYTTNEQRLVNRNTMGQLIKKDNTGVNTRVNTGDNT